MKKIITLSAIFALSVASVVEAKGMRASRSVSGKPLMTQRTPAVQSNTQRDATFTNTPRTATQQTAQPSAQATSGSRLGSFATGAAAGYVLSEMLAPTPAQAQTAQPSENNAMAQPTAMPSPSQVANVAQFRSIGGQIDPFLVEKTDGYRRYCLAGVQYLAPAQGGQTTPIMMVEATGKPLACQLIP